MSLTGGVFLTLVVLLTLAAFVSLVLLWPSLSGRSLTRIAARAGLLLTLNLLVLLTAATQLNARYLFFADWTDLKGALSGTVIATSVTRGGSAAGAVRRPVDGVAAIAVAVPHMRGGLRDGPALAFTVRGPLSGVVSKVVVELPPGYLDAVNRGRRYPVLETFQGYPGAPEAWSSRMKLGGVIADQVALARMGQALIVSPQVEVPAGVDTECVNGRPGYPQLETWLAQDVPNWVAATFRVRSDRASWATVGYSAGGWCAAMITMLHPAQYGAAIVLGGYFHPDFGPFYDPYPRAGALARRYDLVALARRKPPPVALWVETSHSDAISYNSSAALLAAARPPLALRAVVLRHAGHRIGLWQQLLPDALRWLGANLTGFAPTVSQQSAASGAGSTSGSRSVVARS